MDEESVVLNLSEEKLHRQMFSTDQHHQAPILSSNGVFVNGSVVESVDGGSYRYFLRNRFIVVIDCESVIPEFRRIVSAGQNMTRDNFLELRNVGFAVDDKNEPVPEIGRAHV